jgi:hypothetical protein
MKTLLRVAAVCSFGFFALGGLGLLGSVPWLSSTYQDAVPLGVVGLVLIGVAFFVGPMLLVVAERSGRKEEPR